MFSIGTNVTIAFLAVIPIAISLWLKKSYFWSIQRLFWSIKSRHVVITGGSSDIGLWIAIRCVKMGAHVTLLGRNVRKLETAAEKIKLFRVNDKQMIQSRSIDLSKCYKEVSILLSTLEDEIAPIYWLVNCAGGEMYSRHIDIFPDDAIYLMNVKYYAVYYPTRYVLTQMKKRGEGKITITGLQAKELVLEQYGHKPINFDIWKRSSHGLADMINATDLNKNISITLALTDTHKFGHSNFDNDPNRIHIISDRNAPKSEDVANQIVCDSLNGKGISILGWENWINLTVWKFTHCLQSVLQNIRRNSKKKQEHLSSEVTDETTPNSVQLPSEFIDCLSVQSNDTEQSTNASPKPNAIENLNNAETAVDQLLTDQFSSEMHADLIVLQEDASPSNVENHLDKCTTTVKSNGISANEEIKVDDQMKKTTIENVCVCDSTSPSKLTSSTKMLPTVAQSSFGSTSDTLPTSTVESKTDIDFDGPAKKKALLLFDPSHEKPTSSVVSDSTNGNPFLFGTGIKMNNDSTSTAVIVSDAQTMPKDAKTITTSSISTDSHLSAVKKTVDASVTQSTKIAEFKDVLTQSTHSNNYKLIGPTSFSPNDEANSSSDEKSTYKMTWDTATTGNNVDKEKPTYSFNFSDVNNSVAAVNGAKPAKEAGPAISFQFIEAFDSEKPFMFEAKSTENTENVSSKPHRESINAKSKLPTSRSLKIKGVKR